MKAFFFLNFYQDNVISNLADAFPGNDILTFPSPEIAEFAGTWDHQSSKFSGLTVELYVHRTAETPTGADIDYFFLL